MLCWALTGVFYYNSWTESMVIDNLTGVNELEIWCDEQLDWLTCVEILGRILLTLVKSHGLVAVAFQQNVRK